MKQIRVEVNCKRCLYQYFKTSETVVIPEFEPDLKKQLLQNTFFLSYCPRCGSRIDFLHICVYVDKPHGFVLLIKPRQDKKAADHSLHEKEDLIKRYVCDRNDIAEKIRILEHGLDDRVIEILKVKLILHKKRQQQKMEMISFRDVDAQSETIWFDIRTKEGKDCMAVTRQSYENVFASLPVDDHRTYQEINLSWAMEMLKQHA